jgi:hypothetical protein
MSSTVVAVGTELNGPPKSVTVLALSAAVRGTGRPLWVAAAIGLVGDRRSWAVR